MLQLDKSVNFLLVVPYWVRMPTVRFCSACDNIVFKCLCFDNPRMLLNFYLTLYTYTRGWSNGFKTNTVQYNYTISGLYDEVLTVVVVITVPWQIIMNFNGKCQDLSRLPDSRGGLGFFLCLSGHRDACRSKFSLASTSNRRRWLCWYTSRCLRRAPLLAVLSLARLLAASAIPVWMLYSSSSVASDSSWNKVNE